MALTTSTLPSGPIASSNPAVPNLGVTAGSPSGGTFTQGAALPNITTTQTTATAAPQFYTCYLSNLANQGQQAASNAQYVGAQPLQQQAFCQVAKNAGNYQPTLNAAICAANQVKGTNLACAVGNYGQSNIAMNLAPQTTSGIVGTGQFGSTRGAGALAENIANADLGITQLQEQALQQCQANKLAAANTLGNLATTQQNLGLGCVNALSTLGAQQQTIAQNQQLFPLQQLTNESALLRGYTMPTSTAQSYTGPIPGAYAASPLQQIAGIGALAAGISCTALGKSIGSGIGSAMCSISKYLFGCAGNTVSDATQAARNASGTAGINSGNPIPNIGCGSMPTNPNGTIDYSGNNWGGG